MIVVLNNKVKSFYPFSNIKPRIVLLMPELDNTCINILQARHDLSSTSSLVNNIKSDPSYSYFDVHMKMNMEPLNSSLDTNMCLP